MSMVYMSSYDLREPTLPGWRRSVSLHRLHGALLLRNSQMMHCRPLRFLCWRMWSMSLSKVDAGRCVCGVRFSSPTCLIGCGPTLRYANMLPNSRILVGNLRNLVTPSGIKIFLVLRISIGRVVIALCPKESEPGLLLGRRSTTTRSLLWIVRLKQNSLH